MRMNWFNNLSKKIFKEGVSRSASNEALANFERGKQLYYSNQYQDALLHLDLAVNSGFDSGIFEVRGNCLQKMDYHYRAIEDFDKAIEIDPLEYSNYYSRAISKKAILDFTGQIEDLHNAIHYYKKNIRPENLLKVFETDLLSAKKQIEGLKHFGKEQYNVPSLEIKTLIRDSLHLLKKVKLRNAKVNESL